MDAQNRGSVLASLAELGYVPVRISEQAVSIDQPVKHSLPSRRQHRVPALHMAIFTRQFASLIRSAVPILRALNIMEEQTKHLLLRKVLHELAEAVRQGQTLSFAMAQYPEVFSPLYVNLVQSGEITGSLDVILDRLTQQLEQDQAMRAKVRMAFAYPAFVGVVGCFSVMFMFTFVIPRLSRLLLGLGERLPWPTRALLAIAQWVSQPWFWSILFGVILAVGFIWKMSQDRGRLLWERLVLHLGWLGTVVQQSEMARFARSLGLQVNHGISILQAVEISVHGVSNYPIRTDLSHLTEGLRQGTALSDCLKACSVGTAFLVNTIAVGEETGKVGDALIEVANYYERDTERLLQSLANLIEPALILTVGLVVGFIVIAVLLPIFEMGATYNY